MHWSVKIRSFAAALLFAGVLYIFYWAHSHGGFFGKRLEIPIEISQAKSPDVRFSVPEAGDHYVMIANPKSCGGAYGQSPKCYYWKGNHEFRWNLGSRN
jgi:hypothetical protein